MVGVTGATGFVGRHLVEALAARGARVRCLVRSAADLPQQYATRDGTRGNVEVAVGDLLGDPRSLRSFLEGVDVLVHAAGVTESPDVRAYDRANVEGTARLLAASAHTGLERLVYLSTIDVTLGLSDPYPRSKAGGEDAVRARGLPAIILRPSLVYGPGDTKNMATVLATMRRLHIAPIPGSGSFQRQPIFVEDLAAVIVEHVLGPPWIGVRTVTALGPDVVSFRALARSLARAAKLRVVPVFIPVGLLRAVGILARPFVGENPFERVARAAGDRTAASLPAGSPVWIGSTPFAEGLRRTMETSAATGPRALDSQ
jgi:nucleoside-diphosphate-sugar epimerase